ncbi:MAG: Bax inhibitor-1/YccA family protein [Muribaculaceae bacterium]|nr:Bax inhibitor-1/YccA family protein [Muribaculaceae bacterium]
MNNVPPPYYGGGYVSVASQTNAVMKRVYLRMTIGLLVSAFVALGVASSPTLISILFGNPIVYWGMFIAMFIMAFTIPAAMNKLSNGAMIGLFVLFAALMGASLSSIFLVYSLGSITSTFFITAGTFGAMSAYGYFTKTDLTKFGSFLFMALIGLIIASVVNIFLKSATMMWIVSFVGVLIFVGLTAYDTQQVKHLAAANLDPALTDKLATIGALNLYLDFINLFLYLLRFLGASRD